jgi:succinate dehydrogenase / fumarate reductase cytochrome b subunit
MSMNVVALFSAEGYNMICELLGANWYAVVATLGLQHWPLFTLSMPSS